MKAKTLIVGALGAIGVGAYQLLKSPKTKAKAKKAVEPVVAKAKEAKSATKSAAKKITRKTKRVARRAKSAATA
ncbi:MAG: hypothetical protein ABI867_10320 [Kofleriaceae bacterium]